MTEQTKNFAKRGSEDYGFKTTLFQSCVVLFILFPFYKIFYKLKVEGKEKIPRDRAILIAANHLSSLDPPLVSAALLKNIAYMAKKELFTVPILGTLVWWLGAFAVNREKLEVSTIKTAKAVLVHKRWSLALFPQGTRVRDGSLGKVNKGFASLGKLSGTDILPVAVIGSDKKARWPFQGNITVKIGDPISHKLEISEIVHIWSTKISEMTGLTYTPEEPTE